MKKILASVIFTSLVLSAFLVPMTSQAANVNDNWQNVLATYLQPSWIGGLGILLNGSNKYINFGTTYGTTGYGLRDNSGVVEVKNSGGSWTPIGSGGGGGSSGGTFSTTTSTVAGRLINYSNNTTDIVCIGGTATSTCKYWFDPNVPRAFLTGNVGIGSSTPSSALSAYGNITASSFTAASSTGAFATSTFANVNIPAGMRFNLNAANGSKFSFLGGPSNTTRVDLFANAVNTMAFLDDGTIFHFKNVWSSDQVNYGVDTDEPNARYQQQTINIQWPDFGVYNDLVHETCYKGLSGQVNGRSACLSTEGRYQTTSNGDQHEWHLQIDNPSPLLSWRPFQINSTWDGRSNEGFITFMNNSMSFRGAYNTGAAYHTNFDMEAVKFSIGAGIDATVGIPNATFSATLGQRSTSTVAISKSITNVDYLAYMASTSPSVATTSPRNAVFVITNTSNIGFGTSSPFGGFEIVNKENNTTRNIFEVFRQSSFATTSALTVDSMGEVGIGTSSPSLGKFVVQSRLGDTFNQPIIAVASSSLQAAPLWSITATGTIAMRNGEVIENPSSGQVTFRAYNNASLTNCNLNADLGENWAFGATLTVGGDANCGTIRYMSPIAMADGIALYLSSSASAGLVSETAGGNNKYTLDIGTSQNGANNQSGLVRIGTRGNMALNADTVAQPRLRLMPAAGGTGTYLDLYSDNVNNQIDWNAGNLVFGTTTVGAQKNIIFGTTTANTLTRVGIATTSPWTSLGVAGKVAFSGLPTSAGNCVTLNATTKEVQDAGGTTCSTSSEWTKNTLTPVSDEEVIKIVEAMVPIMFKYNDTGDERFGFIAERVDELSKQPGMENARRLVEYAQSDFPVRQPDGSIHIIEKGQPRSFDYGGYTALLTRYMQIKLVDTVPPVKSSRGVSDYIQWGLITLLGLSVIYTVKHKK